PGPRSPGGAGRRRTRRTANARGTPSRRPTMKTTFQLLEDAIELCRAMRPIAAEIEKHDRKLAGQLRGAAQSAAANVAEGMHRRGGHQRERFGVAYGSAQEVKTHLRVAEAF